LIPHSKEDAVTSNERSDDTPAMAKTGGEYVYEALADAGIEVVVGLPGTQTLPIDRTIADREAIDYVMARHETAIPHIAWGYFESSGDVAATLTVPGPGDTNAMHGLKNALEDCVPFVHLSADADPAERGQKPIHEIDPETYETVVKANLNVTNCHELPEQAARAVSIATTPPYGPVRLGIPSGILADEFRAPAADVVPETVSFDSASAIDAAAERLSEAERPAVFLGGGCRRSPEGVDPVRDLVRTLDAPVVASFKGKGVFPENDDRFVGVGAAFLPTGGKRVLEAADAVLALGTDFDSLATDHWDLSMGDSLIHVNPAPSEIDTTPYQADVAVVDDAGVAARALTDAVDPSATDSWNGSRVGRAVRSEYLDSLEASGLLDDTEPAHTPAVLRKLRAVIPDDAVVTADVGGFRLWALELFETYHPEQYVTAGSWAGMGVGLPSALGAALANPDLPIVCLSGDGSLLMCVQELHTLAERDLDVTVVVFNNRDYGTISKSPEIRDYGGGNRFAWRSPDFETIADGFGVPAHRVSTPTEAAAAVESAVDQSGPELVTVDIDPEDPSVHDGADYESTVEL
jgi:acetolactate synthase-1/2/3 large subunit